jgi:hypothetical protein
MAMSDESSYPQFVIVAGSLVMAEAAATLHGLGPLDYTVVIDPDEDIAQIHSV